MLCRNPSKKAAPDDKDRRFWLRRFSDQAICEMAIGISGAAEENFDAALKEVCAWRDRLLPQKQAA